jgi:hypothetical protein
MNRAGHDVTPDLLKGETKTLGKISDLIPDCL